MKTKRLIVIALLYLFMTGTALFAQPCGDHPQPKMHEQAVPDTELPGMSPHTRGVHEAGLPPIPDLTKEQAEKIKQLNLQLRKKILPLDAEINEKEAKLQTLRISDKPEIRTMNALIDDISTLRGSIMKLLNETHFDIRKLLTEDQRTIFDELPPPHPREK